MAAINKACSVNKCLTRVDEMSMVNAGAHYLNTMWENEVRAGTTSRCLAHWLSNGNDYSAYIGSPIRRNRERR